MFSEIKIKGVKMSTEKEKEKHADIFNKITIHMNNHRCSWSFEYKGETHSKAIKIDEQTFKAQIVIINNMLETMRYLTKY